MPALSRNQFAKWLTSSHQVTVSYKLSVLPVTSMRNGCHQKREAVPGQRRLRIPVRTAQRPDCGDSQHEQRICHQASGEAIAGELGQRSREGAHEQLADSGDKDCDCDPTPHRLAE